MKKKFNSYVICWLVLVAIFNVICFTFPPLMDGMDKYDEAFWTGYIFILISFVGNLLCAYWVFTSNSTSKQVYNISLIRITYSSLVSSVIVGTIIMSIPDLPSWLGVIICVSLFGVNLIATVKAKSINGQDVEVREKTLFIKALTGNALTLVSMADTEETKAILNAVYEKIRYSDPMSCDALSGAETQITLKFNKLSNAVKEKNIGEIKTYAEDVIVLVEDRNNKCKLLK